MLNIIRSVSDTFSVAGQTVTFLITLLVFISLFKKHKDENIKITVFMCILMIPLTLLGHSILQKIMNKGTSAAETNRTLKEQNIDQKAKIASLERQLDIARQNKAVINDYQTVNQHVLLQTNLNQVKYWEDVTSREKGLMDMLNDTVETKPIVVNSYNIDAKYGIDMKKIKVRRVNSGKLQIAGVTPVYIGSTKFDKKTMLKEIRKEGYKNGAKVSSKVYTDGEYIQQADNYESEKDREFRENFKNGDNIGPFRKAVTELGQYDIRKMFYNSYPEIEFLDNVPEDDSFVSLDEFIKSEISRLQTEIDNTRQEAVSVPQPQLEQAAPN
ncbi:MAG: hypothetical protein J6Z08_09190 [Elusimicrobiales bacterium]|nr:hypothetical protein [Elusimicrobiales bacterium]